MKLFTALLSFFLILTLAIHLNAQNKTIEVFVVPQSHCDVGWLYTVDEYFDLAVKNILDSVVSALIKDKTRRFIWVETAYFAKWWRQATDTQREQFRYLLTQTKQIEFVIGGHVMHDEALTTYSAQIDQMTHGHQFLVNLFGDFGKPRIGWQIDPFGASGVSASLTAQMGFEYTITARIDYDLKEALKRNKGLEFVWQGSPSLGNKAQIFAHILDNSYCTPWGFDFEGAFPFEFDPIHNPPVNGTNLKNRSEELVEMLKTKASYYATENLLFPYGCDFEYRNAEVLFGNMTLMMNFINANPQYGIRLKYSLLSDYFDTVYKSRPVSSWPVYTSDFSPYADGKHSFWTGYYTSVPRVKEIARKGERIARTAENLFSVAHVLKNIDRYSSYDKLYNIRTANSQVQHHDGITGTERPHVVDMYINDINDGIAQVEDVTMTSLGLLISKNQRPISLSREVSSITKQLQKGDKAPIILYNSLGWARTETMSIALSSPHVVPVDERGTTLPYQVTERLPAQFELFFSVSEIPPLGFKTVFLQQSMNSSYAKPPVVLKATADSAQSEANDAVDKSSIQIEDEDIVLSNSIYDVTVCGATRRLCNIVNKISKVQTKIDHTFETYSSYFNDTAGQTSGAYIFRPLTQQSTPIISSSHQLPQIRIVKGSLFDEVEQYFTTYAKQTIRLYKTNDQLTDSMIEIENTIGPLAGNTEFISKFTTSIQNDRVLHTDSNALETMRRTFNYTILEPVAGNYYSTQYAAYIQDANAQLTVISDRSHGVASLNQGELELMLARRCLQDDDRGLAGFPLNDTSVVQVRMKLILDTPKNSITKRRVAPYLLNYPVESFAVVPKQLWKNFTSNCTTQFSPLSKTLPLNLHLLSWKSHDRESPFHVFRFVNIFGKGEESAYPGYQQTVVLDELLASPLHVVQWIETSLSLMHFKQSKWQHAVPSVINLAPIEMKTLLVSLDSTQ